MIRAWPLGAQVLDPTFITPVDGRWCVGGALRVSPRVDQVMRRVEGEMFLLRRRACGKQSADGVVAVLNAPEIKPLLSVQAIRSIFPSDTV